MPLILGTNSIKDEGYEVANSLRFDDGSTDYLNGSGGAGSTKTKFTFSAWIKRSNLASVDDLIIGKWSSGNDRGHINFSDTPNDTIQLFEKTSGSTTTHLLTNRLFRDVSAWYHIVYIGDTTQGTASNRLKLYVNGVQETSFATATYPNQNSNWQLQTLTQDFGIGAFASTNAGASPFSGYMAEIVYLDGVVADITDFGEFDSDSGIWKPIDVSGLTFGTNGFYLDFENSGSLGADVSGNGNNFTVNNLTSIDQTTDTCTNNWCTLNPLNAYYDITTLSEGNLKYDGNSAVGQYTFTPATMGFSKGKWYWEMKFGSSDSDNWGGIGITSANSTGTQNYLGGSANAYAYYGRTLSGGLGVTYTNNTQTNQGLPFEDGDIIMVAVDCDNLAIYYGKNGTWLNNSSSVTGVPTSGASKTGAFFSITAPSSTTAGFYFPASGSYSGAQVYTQLLNFGSPAFSISSGNSDADGYGNFEYAVPSGYYALNTKNLAEYG
jgi:hypothetical protein